MMKEKVNERICPREPITFYSLSMLSGFFFLISRIFFYFFSFFSFFLPFLCAAREKKEGKGKRNKRKKIARGNRMKKESVKRVKVM